MNGGLDLLEIDLMGHDGGNPVNLPRRLMLWMYALLDRDVGDTE